MPQPVVVARLHQAEEVRQQQADEALQQQVVEVPPLPLQRLLPARAEELVGVQLRLSAALLQPLAVQESWVRGVTTTSALFALSYAHSPC